MNVETNDSSGNDSTNQIPSGEPNDKASGSQSDKNQVAYESYKKVLDEKKSLSKRLDEMQKNLDEINKKALEKENDWKGLFELERKEKEEIKSILSERESKLNEYSERELTAKKFQAFKSQLGVDIDKRYFSLIDLDDVIINPETGHVEETSAIMAAKKFAETYPEILKSRVGAHGAFEGTTSGTSGSKITYEQWVKMSKEEKIKNYGNVIR